MSDRYPGGIIVANPTAPTTTSAPGIWTLEQASYYIGQGTWPLPPYLLNNSLRFRRANNAYLNRTPASAGNRKTWTLSTWVKKGALDVDQIFMECWAANNDNDLLNISWRDSNKLSLGAYNIFYRETTAVYRDVGSWYHVVVAVDTTQATASNRIKMYVNGSLITNFDISNDPAQNANLGLNQAYIHYIGARNGNSINLDGYLSEYHFIDGQQLTPSSFGVTNGLGIWQPLRYTGTYGTNGFYLPFSDIALTSGSNAGLGKDFSGNGNYWTTNNISVTSGSTYDAMTDVPTLTSATAGNYCAINNLITIGTSRTNFYDGNLRVVYTGGANWESSFGTFPMSTGKWYWEGQQTVAGDGQFMFGIANTGLDLYTYSGGIVGDAATAYEYFSNGTKYNNGSQTSYGATFTTNDIIGIAFDADAGTLTFYKNGTTQGTAFTGITGTYIPCVSGVNNTMCVNFGQQPFIYTPPSGFVALNTYNLSAPTITQSTSQFGINLYTGNGSTQSITNTGSFQPGLVWVKERNGTNYHCWNDIVRGTQKVIFSNTDGAQENSGVSAFNSNGFSLDSWTGMNTNSNTYVGWQWKGNGNGVSNTSGSSSSTVSANTTNGFSVVTYTGTGANATVGHGLGTTPSMIIGKCTSAGGYDWQTYHVSLGATKFLKLNSTIAAATASTVWNDTAPTSTVFSIGANGDINANGQTFVAYCFAQIAGFSAFGSYTGNGSSNGPFIYTGFRPAYVLVKGTTLVSNWNSWDAARNTYNWTSQVLRPNSNAAEFDGYTNVGGAVNLLSNGFQIVKSDGDVNNSGSTFIYMAFAENPFKYALAR